MRYIGQIYADNTGSVKADRCILVTSDEANLSEGLPTLIVGKGNAVRMYGKDRVRMLDRRIGENVSWTYSRTEKRKTFETDVEKFITDIVEGITSRLEYRPYGIIASGIGKARRMLRFIRERMPKSIYVTDRHAYIYSSGVVYGISFNETDYIGISRDRIMCILRSSESNCVFDSTEFIGSSIKRHMKDNKIVVPYLKFISLGWKNQNKS